MYEDLRIAYCAKIAEEYVDFEQKSLTEKLNYIIGESGDYTLMATFTTIAYLTRSYAIIFGSNKYELTRAQARISSHLIGFIT